MYRLNSWGEAALQRWPQTMRPAQRGEPCRSKDNVGGNAARTLHVSTERYFQRCSRRTIFTACTTRR